MARIAKSDVHAALRRAADNLIDAAGPDKRVSRDDVKTKLETLDGLERALTDLFFRFIDYRDYAEGATVTVNDVEEGYEYATQKLIDAYDKNDNGLSDDEIAKMSTIGKLAVAYALELDEQPAVMIAEANPAQIEAEMTELIVGLTLRSKADAEFRPIIVPLAPYASLDLDTVRQLFTGVHPDLARDIFGDHRVAAFDLVVAHGEERSFGEWFVSRRMPEDLGDPLAVERAVRTGELVDFLVANVTDPRVFAYSDKINEAGKLEGAVSVFILGRMPSGWLLGVYTASVES